MENRNTDKLYRCATLLAPGIMGRFAVVIKCLFPLVHLFI
jgi:hypothetical protein